MITVTLQPITHRSQECIAIKFKVNAAIREIVRKIQATKWSKTHKCWYLPLNSTSCINVYRALEGRAHLDIRELEAYMLKTKKPEFLRANANSSKSSMIIRAPVSDTIKRFLGGEITSIFSGISSVNAHILPEMKQFLILKSYSASTRKTYMNEMSQFLRLIGNHLADSLNVDKIRAYLVYCSQKLQLSENTLHSRINALKFYYEQVLGRERFFWQIPRPKRPFLLPRLLNEDELRRLFNALSNKKHKAMLFTAYSAGLRVSELIHLRISDIDSQRMQIFIRRAKGKKDRYVNLSPVLLDILRQYIKEYRPKPKEFLFESEQTFTAYPARTVQQIFQNAKLRAGISKEVGIHSLRHSFATHLLDKGTDIRYIKELLGHFNIKTTERYLHVSKKMLVNIGSPFDDLWKNEKIEW
ncbi:MAG TPA: tyrosine-type recombinase/integrase [Chitinophagaceae bacterium]|nr:tyrosine-type recombinase/integrase [Chitinophagaceae bacterium]